MRGLTPTAAIHTRSSWRIGCAAFSLALALASPSHAQPAAPAADIATGADRFALREVRLSGQTVLSDADLQSMIAPLLGHVIGIDEVETIRRAITDWYVQRGYINSGATVPPQTIADGVLRIDVIEGSVTAVDITGTHHFAPGFFVARLQRGIASPFNVNDLALQQKLLLQNPYVRRLDLDIQPGMAPGEAHLAGRVTEASPYGLSLQVSNDQSPSVGDVHGLLAGSIGNLLGYGDVFSFSYGRTSGLDEGSVSYSVPIADDDTRLTLRYDIGHNLVINQDLRPLDITSRDQTIGLAISRPFLRTAEQTLLLGAAIEQRQSRTYLLGQPFSFVAGADNGKTNVSVIRLTQDWLDQTDARVIAARSTMSVGIDALGATVTHAVPSGTFVAWLGQAQYVRRLSVPALLADVIAPGAELVLRGQVQLSGNALFPLEQLSLGGIDSVRGYRQYLARADNGTVGTAELRLPVARWTLPTLADSDESGTLQFVPFYDQGVGWNTGRAAPPLGNIASIGAGLRWLAGSGISAEIYVGHGLRSVHVGTSLQDRGIFFRISSRVF